MKKLIIIGGGIAGLTAGIYALQNDYDVAIYEKNPTVGGECTGWNRQGYHVDNCIHWLTGCRPEDDLYKIWRNIGAINETTAFYREPYFYKLEMDGHSLHLWCDIEKAREEFLTAAVEDSEEINKFFDSVKRAESIKVPCDKSLAEMGFIEYMKFGMTMAEMGRVIKEYGKDSIGDLANRFKNPYVRKIMSSYLNRSCKAITLLSSYGFYTSGTAAIPIGGSVKMVQRIAQRVEELGGHIHTGISAEKINISGGRAESVTFSDGSILSCDSVICAVDPSVTFGALIDQKYMDKKLRKMYQSKNEYQITSGFNASFGIVGEEDYSLCSGSLLFPCDSLMVGKQKIDFMGMRLYDYDDTLFPKNKRVIQCNILQDEHDYDYWIQLYHDKERYNAEKQRIAQDLKLRIISRYPALKDRLILLDTYSPMTFTKWCGAYKGSYMSFFEQKGSKSLTAKNSVRGLTNVFLASQWLTTNGGLPLAAASGKFAVDGLIKAEM